MIADQLVLTGFPVASTTDDYGRAGEELEQALAQVPGAVAVYRYGGVTAPGISDLDRLVVTEDGRPVPSIWPQLTERTRYLAMHTPARADPETFARHRWFSELGTPELVWGTPIPVEDRPVPEYSEPLLAAEALVVSALKLRKLSVTGRAKVRPWLCELSNLRLDLHHARIGNGEAPHAWSLVEEVQRVRRDWWNLVERERHGRMRRLLESAPAAVAEALRAVHALADCSGSPASVALAAPWQNVSLVQSSASSEDPPPRLRSLVGRSRRFGEARWRWKARRMPLPEQVMTLLAGPVPERFVAFRAERDRLLKRQAELSAASPGYSGLRLGATLAR